MSKEGLCLDSTHCGSLGTWNTWGFSGAQPENTPDPLRASGWAPHHPDAMVIPSAIVNGKNVYSLLRSAFETQCVSSGNVLLSSSDFLLLWQKSLVWPYDWEGWGVVKSTDIGRVKVFETKRKRSFLWKIVEASSKFCPLDQNWP